MPLFKTMGTEAYLAKLYRLLTIPKRLLTMLRVLLVLGRRLPSRYLYIRERLAICDALRDLLSWIRTSNC